MKIFPILTLSTVLLVACGESDAPQGKATVSSNEATDEVTTDIMFLPSQVVYQEEIYKNWPYTEAPSETAVVEVATAESVVEAAEPVVNANPQTYTINAEARIFRPDTIYINPGDTVGWRNMTSHNTVSVEGMIPEGATPWAGKLGQNLKVTLDVEGIYAYVCQPHIGFGMVGLIIVGNPANLEEVKSFARDNLKGPFRRLIGKLNKVTVP